jgi:glycosyltransferase involved in cell wall biosynthesis
LNLLHYCPTTLLTEGGTVRAALDICVILAKRGHAITWLTCDDTDVPDSWKNCEPNTPTVHFLGTFQNSGKRLSKHQLELATESIQQADVTHIHAMWDLSNPQIAKACTASGTPWVLSTHGMLDDWSMAQRGLKKRMYVATAARNMLQNAAVIHTTAKEEKKQAKKWIKHSRIEVVPCIVDLNPYQKVPSKEEAVNTYGAVDEPTILFLSRVHEKKSIETLIDAVAILKELGTKTRLFIAGTGDENYIHSLKTRAITAGVDESVHFLGMVVGNLKLSLYAMVDVFALPTQQENFGLVYPEAMLCETPVIGTKGTDIWKELEEGGAVIADRTAAAFADAIITLTSDSNRLKELGEQGRKHILGWLDSDSVARGYENIYQSALTNVQ